MFSVFIVLHDSKVNKLGSSNQEDSPLAGKTTEIVLMPCLLREKRPNSYF